MTNGTPTNLAVDYGAAKGNDARVTGAEAAQQAVSNLTGQPSSAVLLFASICYDLAGVLQGIHTVVGDAAVLGGATAGEICRGPHQESVVALASSYLNVHVGDGRAVSADWQQAATQATATATPEIQTFFPPRIEP